MALREFECLDCKIRFEQIVSSNDPDAGKCPKCHTKNTRRLISVFAVGGQGDLRESTMHGCHEGFTGLDGDTGPSHGGHDHGHEHDHGHGHDHGNKHGHGDGSET